MEPMPMQYEQQPPPVYMEQPKTPLKGIFASLNTRVLKEPRGFMKILQFIFSICAFATTTNFSSSFSFRVLCKGNQDNSTLITEKIVYPFRIDSIRTSYKVCGNSESLHLSGDFSSDAEFFVAVGVLAFLYVIGALVLYTLFSSIYDNNDLVPVVDCGAHVVFAILWLAGSSAWANSLTNLRMATNVQTIIKEHDDFCGDNICHSSKEPGFSGLYISIILGFLNVFLWASNLWFLYKETHFFKDKMNSDANAANIPGAH
ncbi:synaptophysin-like isoform X2 [Panulirus ornatus]|uniref:synaptophysin-like isoform X2 n=1 Tax=Panulirus ornatus TaxID=150431 RepID=UPI003A88980D